MGGTKYKHFYGNQSEQFTFYKVPKQLFVDEEFHNISAEAKLLYGILLDRMSLSSANGWRDEEGKVYIIFTVEEVQTSLGCAEKKAIKLLNELESKCGLIDKVRQGLGKPNIIYVKNFLDSGVENYVERQFLNCQNDSSGAVKNTVQELSKGQCNNTDINKTLNQEEQKYANIFLHDVQRGDVIVEEGKTLRDYITEYQFKAKNDQIHRFADTIGIDEDKLRGMMCLKLTETNINEFGNQFAKDYKDFDLFVA